MTKRRATHSRTIPKTAKVILKPSDLLHIPAGEPFTMETAAALRRALVVTTDSPQLRKQIAQDCHISDVYDGDYLQIAEAVTRKKRQVIDTNQRVAVIIPNYNYRRFIGEALDSVIGQSRLPDEIIVVDDASTDDSAARVLSYIAQAPRHWPPIRLIQHPTNRGNVGAARNTGIAATDAQYILCLDSDDVIEPTYIETCLKAIQADQGIGVVYTGVQTLEQADGTNNRVIWTDWPKPFNWDWMAENHIPFNTCIPTASMYRREFWRRAGGYDEGIASAEDLEFWMRALSCGWEAVKCTAEPLFVYRRHGPSMTTQRKQTNVAAFNRVYTGHTGIAAPTGKPPVLRDYTKPAVSVIIPCGPKHAALLPTAIASVLAQSMDQWEIVVVNDTGGPLPLEPWPFIKQVFGSQKGVGAARNLGIEAATAPLLFFLDADDYIMPDALARMIAAYATGNAGYVYSGWWFGFADKKPEAKQALPYSQDWWVREDSLAGPHAISVLIAKADAVRIGTFDEDLPSGFEDREFFARCAIFGVCGVAVSDPLLVYRWDTGTQRQSAKTKSGETDALMSRRYGPFVRGEKQMAGCCGGNSEAAQMAADIINERGQAFNAANAPRSIGSGTPYMIYKGPRSAPVTFFNTYEGWRGMDAIPVAVKDVERLSGLQWELVEDFPHVPQPAAIYPAGAGTVEAADSPKGDPVELPDEIKEATPEQFHQWRMENGWLTESEAAAKGMTQLEARIAAGKND